MIDLGSFRGVPVFVTHIQLDEIERTRDEKRKRALLRVFRDVPKESLPTSSTMLGLSRLDHAKLGDDANTFKKMLKRLQELDRKKHKTLTAENQARDILIGETALKEGLTIITEDSNLAQVVIEFGGSASTLGNALTVLRPTRNGLARSRGAAET